MENIMSRLIRISQSLLLTATLIAASAGAGVYYKWEKDGITQYTKEKPRDVPFEEVRTLGGKGIGPSSAPAAAAPAEPAATSHANNSEQPAPVKKDPKVCQQAKTNLETLQSTAIVRMKDEYGNETVMDDKQRESQLQRAQEAIKTNC